MAQACREARASALWGKYSFPPNVWVSFPLLGPQLVAYTKDDRGRMNFM